MASLVERLRGANGWYFEPHMPQHDGNDGLLEEAASTIEALEQELRHARADASAAKPTLTPPPKA